MRFRWVPSTVDSLLPFLVGILQFIMIDNLGIERISVWLLLLALLFAGMNWISHHNMKRARLNPENEQVVVADDFWQLSMSLDSVNDQAERNAFDNFHRH